MITETLLNSLKSLFSSLGAKTSDNNYAVGLFDKTSGEPKGMMGMLNLASVLGVPTKGILGTEDFNNIDENGVFTLGNNINSYPHSPSIASYGVLLVFRGYSTYCVQIAIGTSNIAFRLRAGAWESWISIK